MLNAELFQNIPDERYAASSASGRHDLPDIAEMVDSLLEYGQLQPVTIRKMAGKPVLVAGFTRFRAVAHINAHAPSRKSPLIDVNVNVCVVALSIAISSIA